MQSFLLSIPVLASQELSSGALDASYVPMILSDFRSQILGLSMSSQSFLSQAREADETSSGLGCEYCSNFC